MSHLTEIGRVIRLQVAPEVPKIAGATRQRYDPSPLLAVERLILSAGGVSGIDAQEREVLDVHHEDHPRSRFRGDNALSIGFSEHYKQMRQIFGAHIVDGSAAENILIQATERVSLDKAGTRIILDSFSGHKFDLGRAIVAEPCAPFARWALGEEEGGDFEVEPGEVKRALELLRRGTRGFYLGTSHLSGPVEVRVGDHLFAMRPQVLGESEEDA